MPTEKQNAAIEALLDRAAITQVVQDWGLSRDAGRWDKLQSFYTRDAIMYTTWFVGPATEFVQRSMEAAKKGARGQHFIGAASIDINGNKAIAETRMMLLVRGMLEGIEVDVTCYGRFYDRFVKPDGQWLIQKRMVVYEKDRMDVLDPALTLKLDHEELMKRPDGYRHLAYLQSRAGASITPDLPTPNSPQLARLYAEGEAWLGADSVDMQNQARESV